MRCRYCRCTEDNACVLEDGDTCILNEATMVCNRPACVIAQDNARKAYEWQQKQANRKRTPAEVQAVIAAEKKQSRKASNAKYRAKLKRQGAQGKSGRVA